MRWDEAWHRTVCYIGGYLFGSAFTAALVQYGAPWYGYVLVGTGFLFAFEPWKEVEGPHAGADR